MTAPSEMTAAQLVLLDPIGALQRPDVGDNHAHVLARDALYRRHVAERPMVRPRTELSRHQEGLIAVVARLVDAVHEGRRNTVPPGGSGAMARGAVRIIRCPSRPPGCAEFRNGDGDNRRPLPDVFRVLAQPEIHGNDTGDHYAGDGNGAPPHVDAI